MLSGKEIFSQLKEESLPERVGQKDYAPDESWEDSVRLQRFYSYRREILKHERVRSLCSLVEAEWIDSEQRVRLSKNGKFSKTLGYAEGGANYLQPEEALFLMDEGAILVQYGGMPLSLQEAHGVIRGSDVTAEEFQVFSHFTRLGYILHRYQGASDTTDYEDRLNLPQYKSKKGRKSKQQGETITDQHSLPKRTKLEDGESVTSVQPTSVTTVPEETTHQSTTAGHRTTTSCVDQSRKIDNCDIIQNATPDCVEENQHIDYCDVTHISTHYDVTMDSQEQSNSRSESDMCQNTDIDITSVDVTKLVNNSCKKKTINLINTAAYDQTATENMKFETEVQTRFGLGDEPGNISVEHKIKMAENIEDSSIRNNFTNSSFDCLKLSSLFMLGERAFVGVSLSNSPDCFEPKIDSKQKHTNNKHCDFDDIDIPNIRGHRSSYTFCCKPACFMPHSAGVIREQITLPLSTCHSCEGGEEELVFSQGMAGVRKVMHASDWSEYKSKMAALRSADQLVTSPVGYLWSGRDPDDVTPLLQPRDAVSTGALLKKLKVIENVNLFSKRKRQCVDLPQHAVTSQSESQHVSMTSPVCVQPCARILFDGYAPNTAFVKTRPGKPQFRLAVVSADAPVPDMRTLSKMAAESGQDGVPLIWAIIQAGDISFFSFNGVDLPRDISLG